jgi:hypothetical protein
LPRFSRYQYPSDAPADVPQIPAGYGFEHQQTSADAEDEKGQYSSGACKLNFRLPPEQDKARFGSAFRDRPIIS